MQPAMFQMVLHIHLQQKNAADTEAPTAPGNVAVTDVTTTTAKVTWSEATDNVGVVGYNVYLNEEKVKRNTCNDYRI